MRKLMLLLFVMVFAAGVWVGRNGMMEKTYAELRTSSRAELDREFEAWTADAAQWKREGHGAVERYVAARRAEVVRKVEELRRMNHLDEARRLEQRFTKWVEEIRK
jgi:hypothetical protein